MANKPELTPETEAKVAKLDKHVSEYRLPDGAVLVVRRPLNKDRRVLMEQPDARIHSMLETIAAGCITKMTLPEGYIESPDGEKHEFSGEPKAEHFQRLDKLSLLDSQSFTVCFESLNMPTKEIVENITGHIKKALEAKK